MTSNYTDVCIIHTNFGIYVVVITIIVSFVSICECLAVILVTLSTNNWHVNTNILVASLAVNDLLLAVAFIGNQMLAVPHVVSHSVKSKLLISLIYGTSSGSTNVSVMYMAVIALDRYIQIAYPFYYRKAMSKTRAYLMLLGLWITYLIFFIIPLTVYYDDKYHTRCIILHQPIVYSFAGLAVYAISVIVVFICYFNIAYVAFKRKQSANCRRLPYNVSQAEIELRDNVMAALRSVKFFALMFGIFFICTCPPFVSTVLGFSYSISENIYVGLFSLVPIHTTINFLIYTYMNKEFYTSLVRKLLALKDHCCKYNRET